MMKQQLLILFRFGISLHQQYTIISCFTQVKNDFFYMASAGYFSLLSYAVVSIAFAVLFAFVFFQIHAQIIA
mgnify:CR=1 FL=1